MFTNKNNRFNMFSNKSKRFWKLLILIPFVCMLGMKFGWQLYFVPYSVNRCHIHLFKYKVYIRNYYYCYYFHFKGICIRLGLVCNSDGSAHDSIVAYTFHYELFKMKKKKWLILLILHSKSWTIWWIGINIRLHFA